jgi:hypothetical protein
MSTENPLSRLGSQTIEKDGFSNRFTLFDSIATTTLRQEMKTAQNQEPLSYDAFFSKIVLDLANITPENKEPLPRIPFVISATPHAYDWNRSMAIAPFTPAKARQINPKDTNVDFRRENDSRLRNKILPVGDSDTALYLSIRTDSGVLQQLSIFENPNKPVQERKIQPHILSILNALRFQIFIPSSDGLEAIPNRLGLTGNTDITCDHFYPFDIGPLPIIDPLGGSVGYYVVLPTNPPDTSLQTGLEKVQQIKARFRLDKDQL